MKTHIQRLSSTNEFFLVTLLFFGYPIFNSFRSLFNRIASNKLPLFTDFGVARMLSIEICILVTVSLILVWRGYSKKDMQISINPKSTLYGLWILFKYYFISIVIFALPLAVISMFFVLDLPSKLNPFFTIKLNYLSIFALALINPLFEELALVGYLFTSIEKIKDTNSALYISIAVRVLYHTYQGFGVLSIAVFGYVLGKTYIHKRNLWPLIVCHGCVDIISLLANKLLYGS